MAITHSDRSPTASLQWAGGLAFAALSVLIFSGWFVVTRFTVTHDLHVWDVTALRFGAGAVLLAPVLLRRRLRARDWLDGLLFALLWGAPFVLLVGTGLKLTTAAHASSIAPALMPVAAGIMSWGATRQLPPRRALWSYAAILGGLATLVLSRPAAGQAAEPMGYAALALAATTWAAYSVCLRGSRLSALESAALICFWSALLFLPAYVGLGLSHLALASWREVAFQLLYQGVLMSGVALFAYNRAIAALGTGGAAAMMALIPVLATLLAIPILGEIPSAAGMAAILAMAAGVAMAARPPPPSHRTAKETHT